MPITTPSYVYPTQVELETIDQDLLPVLQQNNPIFRLFPVRTVDSALVEWEQRDSYLGLMQTRGLEGEYPSVNPQGYNRYMFEPSRFGEHSTIAGRMIETRAAFGSLGTPIDVRDIVVERQEQLATRHFNLMSSICWGIVTQGYYRTIAANGAVVRQDAVNLQSYTASTLWSDPANSTPLKNFREVKLLHRGHSTAFDGTAEAWMNSTTFNYMIANANTADLFGRRSQGLETIEGLGQYNASIATRDNLPQIMEYDDGYLDANGVFQLWIPDGVVVVVGKRSNGASLGDFAMTRNADNGNSSTPLVKVVEHGTGPNQAPPVKLGVYRGFNGGPRIYYPSSIVIMNVA